MGRLTAKRGGRANYAQFQVTNPGKGWNSAISENLIDDREASDLENIQFIESGAPSKAYGYDQLGDTLSNNPRGLGFYQDTSFNKYLCTVDGTALKYLSGSTWTTISGATFDSSAVINMTQAQGNMYICDGVSGIAQLSGSTLTRPATTPKAKFSIYYNGYHIAAGVATQDNRAYISVNNDPAKFTRNSTDSILQNSTEVPGASSFAVTTTANYVDINKNDGDKITGFGKFQDVLLIYKERSIWQLQFDSASATPTVTPVTKSYGAVSHRAIDNMENDVIFLSRNGFYVLGNEPNFNAAIRTNELSTRIHPIIETISTTSYDKASGMFNQYLWYCGIPSGGTTTNNVTLTYDRRYQAWSNWTHVKPESMTTYIDSNNQEWIAFTSADSAKVFRLRPGTYNANGSAISAQWTSKAFDLGDFSTYKRWIDVTLFFRQLIGQVTVTIITDNGTIVKTQNISNFTDGGIGSEMFGELLFGGEVSDSGTTTANSTNNVPYRLRVSTKARSLKIKVSSERVDENFVLLGFQMTYRNYSHFVFPSAQRL